MFTLSSSNDVDLTMCIISPFAVYRQHLKAAVSDLLFITPNRQRVVFLCKHVHPVVLMIFKITSSILS